MPKKKAAPKTKAIPKKKATPKKKASSKRAPTMSDQPAKAVKGLSARDIMTDLLVTLKPTEKLRDAMAQMVANHVTGLPVVDREGHCLGVVSVMDILSYEEEHAEPDVDEIGATSPFFDEESQKWEDVAVTAYALEHIGEVAVNEIMTADLIAVSPNASVRHVAARMAEASVHRVMVLDEKRFLHGVISASDFVRLVADGSL